MPDSSSVTPAAAGAAAAAAAAAPSVSTGSIVVRFAFALRAAPPHHQRRLRRGRAFFSKLLPSRSAPTLLSSCCYGSKYIHASVYFCVHKAFKKQNMAQRFFSKWSAATRRQIYALFIRKSLIRLFPQIIII
jgi:hypothetical protein